MAQKTLSLKQKLTINAGLGVYAVYLSLRNTEPQQTFGLVLSLSIGQQYECIIVRYVILFLFQCLPISFFLHFSLYILSYHAQNV